MVRLMMNSRRARPTPRFGIDAGADVLPDRGLQRRLQAGELEQRARMNTDGAVDDEFQAGKADAAIWDRCRGRCAAGSWPAAPVAGWRTRAARADEYRWCG